MSARGTLRRPLSRWAQGAASLVMAGVVVGLSGCTWAGSADGRVVSADDASTRGVDLVLMLSPQSLGLNRGLSGYMVMVAADGTYSMLETSGMNSGEIDWREDGVFFSDHEFDYRLTDSLESTASPKANLQRALFYDEAEGAYVGVYNNGFSEDGYIDHLVVADGETSTLSEVEGGYAVLAQCENEIFGVAPLSGQYLTGADRELAVTENSVGQMLTQLYPSDTGSERLVGTSGVLAAAEAHGNAPCVEGLIHYPSFNFTGGSHGDETAVLRTWNTQTGTSEELKLITADGAALELTADDVIYAGMLSETVDEELVWVLSSGDVLSTDVATGETAVIHSFTLENVGGPLNVKVYGDRLWAMEVPTQQSDPVVLHSSQLRTGQDERSFQLDAELSEMLSVDLVLRDFALAPDRSALDNH